MSAQWKIQIKNYLKQFENQQLFVDGCENIIRNHFDELKQLPKSTKYNYLTGVPVPLDLLLKLCNPEELEMAYKNVRLFASRSNEGVKLPKFLTSELSYVVGALRDGSISKSKTGNGTMHTLAITQSGGGAKRWLRSISRIFKKSFGLNPKIDECNNEFRLRVFSKPIVLFFEKIFEMPQTQRAWETPALIKQNPRLWPYYTAGFFDAEG
ncbi:hypothetical protein HY992_03930 [Candidatus Micrarchaeota archaeon]|nr:hypothetical protein [Candidatus Micrarchaeota archaeon]